jgi:hypothetical protein
MSNDNDFEIQRNFELGQGAGWEDAGKEILEKAQAALHNKCHLHKNPRPCTKSQYPHRASSASDGLYTPLVMERAELCLPLPTSHLPLSEASNE